MTRYTILSINQLLLLKKKKIPVKSQETPEKEGWAVSRNPSHAKPEGKQTA